MTEIGKVTKINGPYITLTCKPCPVCHGCGSHTCASLGREVTARNSLSIALKPGDKAEISVPPVGAARAALWAFGIPVAVFAAFYVGAGYVFGPGSEAAPVLSGLAGLALGAVIMFFAGRRSAVFPEIVRGVDTGGAADGGSRETAGPRPDFPPGGA